MTNAISRLFSCIQPSNEEKKVSSKVPLLKDVVGSSASTKPAPLDPSRVSQVEPSDEVDSDDEGCCDCIPQPREGLSRAYVANLARQRRHNNQG